MKRIIFALWAVLFASAASAQQFGAAGQQPIIYPLIAGAPEQLGDGSNAHGGTPPAATLVAPIASNFDTSVWKYAAAPPPNVVDGDGSEPKFRTHCNPAKAGWFDPILYPGQANAGHPHLFFGNTGITKDATFTSIRTTGGSTCGGGPLNRSGYWPPGLMLADTANTNVANKMLKNDFSVAYYNAETIANAKKSVPYGVSLNYINGYNLADPTNSRYDTIIANNNGRPGQTAVYTKPYSGQKWKCEDVTVQGANAPRPNQIDQPYFRKKDGSWSMVCGLNNPALPHLIGEVVMQECWDGKNLSSPDGRGHVMPVVQDTISGQYYCPNNWYHLPKFEQTMYFSVSNAEIASGRLFLSCDRMSSNQSLWTDDGKCLHQDWFDGWDRPTMNAWLSQCLGLDDVPGQPAIGTPRDCTNTNYGDGTAGLVAQTAPDGSRSPQVDLGIRQNTKGVYRYYPVVKPLGPVMSAHTHGM